MGVGSINLNRFQNAQTLQYLRNPDGYTRSIASQLAVSQQGSSSNISVQNLLGGANQPNRIQANTQFTTQANDFTPGYGVNQPPAGILTLFDSGSFVGFKSNPGAFLRNGQGLETQRVGAINQFGRPLNVSFSGANGSRFAPSFQNGPSNIPLGIPSQFKSQVDRFELSEQNFDVLKNGADFVIGRTGPLGFKVLTDGAGNITGIETKVAEQANRFDGSGFNEGRLVARQALTEGAVFRGLRPGDVRQPSGAAGQVAGQGAINGVDNRGANRLGANNGLSRGGINFQNRFQLDALRDASRLNFQRDVGLNAQGVGNTLQQGSNVVLENLRRLSALSRGQGNGVAVAGVNSELGLDGSLKLAAVKSGFGVELNRNVALGDQTAIGVRNTKQSEQLNTQAQLLSPYRQAAELTGTIPMVPTLPGVAKTGGETASLSVLSTEIGMSFSTDAMDKRSKGGYIPFRMGGGNDGGGASASGSGLSGGGQQPSGGQSSFSGGGFSGGRGFGEGGASQQSPQNRRQRRSVRLFA